MKYRMPGLRVFAARVWGAVPGLRVFAARVWVAVFALHAEGATWGWKAASGGNFEDAANWELLGNPPTAATTPPGKGMAWALVCPGTYTVTFNGDYTRENGNELGQITLEGSKAEPSDATLDLGGHTLDMTWFCAGNSSGKFNAEPDPETGERDPRLRVTVTNGTVNCYCPENPENDYHKGVFMSGMWNGNKQCAHIVLSGPEMVVNAEILRFNGGYDSTVGNSFSVLNGAKIYAREFGNSGKTDLLVSGEGSRFDISGKSPGVPGYSQWRFEKGAEFSARTFTMQNMAELVFDGVTAAGKVAIAQQHQHIMPIAVRIRNVEMTFTHWLEDNIHSAAVFPQGTNCVVEVSDSTVYDFEALSYGMGTEWNFRNAKVTKGEKTNYPSISLATDGWTHSKGGSNQVMRVGGEKTKMELNGLRLAYGARLEFEVGEAGFESVPVDVKGGLHFGNAALTNRIELVVDGFCRRKPKQTVALMKWVGANRWTNGNQFLYDPVYNLTNEVYITRGSRRVRASEIVGTDRYFGKVEIVDRSASFDRGTLTYTAPAALGMILTVK